MARSVRGLAQILEDLDRAGVVFRSATEPFDTGTPAGRMMVQMLGVFAEFERATIIDRVVAGMERKAAKGGWTVGGRPFGYEIDSETGFLVVKEEEAQLVPMIFDLYLRERLGARSIGNWLNDRGYRTKAGKPWSHMSVLTVLRNNAYVGEIYFRGESYPAPHSALVERATFDAAQQLLTERGEDHSKRASNRSDYILASKIVCQRCGKHFVGSAATGNMYRYSYYTCFSRQRYGRHGCDAERLPSEELEAKILDSLIETFADKGLVSAAIEEARTRADSERPQIERELEAIQSEIRKVEGRIEKYLTAFEEGSMPEAVCGPRLEGLGERLAELKRRKEGRAPH